MRASKAVVLALLLAAAVVAVASASQQTIGHSEPKGLSALRSNTGRRLLRARYYGGAWGRAYSPMAMSAYPYTWQRWGMWNPPAIPSQTRMDTAVDRQWARVTR